MKLNLRGLILASLFAALTAVCARISINTPLAPVPITLQTFAVFMSAVILGSKYGALSQIVYIMIGIVGMPVFSNGGSGLGWLIGPTGGFLLSFPVISFVIGFVMERKKQVSRTDVIGLLVIGMIICYTFGTLQFGLIKGYDYVKAINAVVIPFIPFDIVKLIAASILGYQVRMALKKASLL
ncbi:MAG: biotin transporter BioY [Clostridia bacterium]|nr:biotin transporter BioY [Clostridia bacterium]